MVKDVFFQGKVKVDLREVRDKKILGKAKSRILFLGGGGQYKKKQSRFVRFFFVLCAKDFASP